jgi:hypothetical protein
MLTERRRGDSNGRPFAVSGNVIDDEAVDIVTNTPAQVNVHLNDLLGGSKNIGVDNISMDRVHGTVDARRTGGDSRAALVRKRPRRSAELFSSRLG